MKLISKTILLLVIMGCTRFMVAQTVNQGAWMIGGSAGFSSEKVKDADASTTTINITPNLAYYLIDDLALGVRLNFISQSYDGESDSNFGFGPYVRYYITDPIFVQAGYDIEAAALDLNSLFNADGSSTIHLGVGYSWFLNNSIAIEPLLYYDIYNGDEDNFDADLSRFGLNIGVQAFIGRTSGGE